MSGRLWYPQLDIYDAIRRLAGLLAIWGVSTPPSQERLFIADFYLANPPLLHLTHMAREVRTKFYELGIARPAKAFISYPSPPILFQKMAEVQRQAFLTLAGKGLIDIDKLERGSVLPSRGGKELFEERFVPLLGECEHKLAGFLIGSFANSDGEIAALRRSTGLRRISR